MSPIVNPASEFFKNGLWGWDGTVWRKLPLVFGYTDRWAEDLSWPVEEDGMWAGWTALVPAGYIYVAQGISVCNNTGARGERYVYFVSGANFHCKIYTAHPAQGVADIWNGEVTLKERDYVYMTQVSCLAGDVIEAQVWGYKMKVNG